jgi:hypothetical protein
MPAVLPHGLRQTVAGQQPFGEGGNLLADQDPQQADQADYGGAGERTLSRPYSAPASKPAPSAIR